MEDNKKSAQKTQNQPKAWKVDTSQVKSIEETLNTIDSQKKPKEK